MRFFKDANNIYRIIAGEMLNIEGSFVQFEKGEPLPIESQKKGYPVIWDNNVSYTIKSNCGYIYLPHGVNLRDFETNLTKALTELSGGMDNHLRDYHSINVGHNTNTMVKSSLGLTANSWENRINSNIKRKFLHYGDNRISARFIWYICFVNKMFPGEITSKNISARVSQIACGICYDRDDIFLLHDNDITFEINESILKWYNLVAFGECIKLLKYGPPVLIEFNSYWSKELFNSYNSPKYSLRNILCSPIMKNYDRVVNSNKIPCVGGENCSTCGEPTFDNNYVVANPTDKTRAVVCPLCMHIATLSPVEINGPIYMIRSPVTLESKIESVEPAIKKEILIETLKGIEERNIIVDGCAMRYYLIGDKFIGVENHIFHFLCTGIMRNLEMSNRRICKVAMVR